MATSTTKRYLIIGNGASGTYAAETIRKTDADGEITLLTNEPYPLYNRVALPPFLRDEARREKVFLRTPEQHEQKRIKLLCQTQIENLDTEARVATAADQVVIEDWKAYPVGTTGLPGDWKPQNWGTPHYENLKIVEDEGRRALYMKSVNDSSTINKEIKGKVHLKDTPMLEWQWKSIVLPKGANSCKKATDDQAGQIFIVWPRFPEAVRSRIIGYVWDTTQPAGTICKSEKTGTVTYVVVHSGPTDLNRWVTEKRNVVEDFKKIYGEAPDDPSVLSLSIDSNDTNTSSEAMYGPIVFKKQ